MSKWNVYSSDCRILFHKNPTEWGIFSNNLRSEEYSIFISSSDSSDCRILMHQKNLQTEEFLWFPPIWGTSGTQFSFRFLRLKDFDGPENVQSGEYLYLPSIWGIFSFHFKFRFLRLKDLVGPKNLHSGEFL